MQVDAAIHKHMQRGVSTKNHIAIGYIVWLIILLPDTVFNPLYNAAILSVSFLIFKFTHNLQIFISFFQMMIVKRLKTISSDCGFFSSNLSFATLLHQLPRK